MEPTSQPSRGREPRTEGRAMIANPENRQDCPRTAAGCRDDGSTVPRPGIAPDGDSDAFAGFPAWARPPPIGPAE